MKIPFDIKYRPQIESGEYYVETTIGSPVKNEPKGYDPDYLQSCINKATDNGFWKGVDVDEFMDEVRGREPEEKSEILTNLDDDFEAEFKRIAKVKDWTYAQIEQFKEIAIHFAEWQKKQDQETIELAEEHAMLAGRMQMKEEMLKEAVEGSVVISYIDRDGVSYGNIVSTDIPTEKYGIEEGSKCKFLILKDDESRDS